ncbi:MAG: hypothetical protein M1819_005836 [Sarea resinae]|nr:MAG: hypothetical protein M1819_005836 [Sarea resinae]
MPTLRNVKVTICSGGKDLEEFEDPGFKQENADPQAREAVVYIESSAGAEFSFKVDFTKGSKARIKDDVQIKYWFDGDFGHTDSVVVKGDLLPVERHIDRQVNFFLDDQVWRDCKFAFGQVQQGREHLGRPLHLKAPGTITVKISRGKLGTYSYRMPDKNNLPTVKEAKVTGIIPDTEKFVDHFVRGIRGMIKNEPASNTTVFHPSKRAHDLPILFKFRYRSRQTLQNLGLLLRTPQPAIEAAQTQNIGALNGQGNETEKIETEIAEIEERAKKLKVALAARQGIKRERVGSGKTVRVPASKRVKTERTAGEIIDLTDD